MLLRIIQFLAATTPEIPDKKENLADSTKAAITNIAQQISDDPAAFFTSLGESVISFGVKRIGAILIYIIGAFVIKWIKKLLSKFFASRKTEKTVASFVSSLVSILLTIILIVMTINALGINTVSITALLAAGGVAIGMALSGTLQNFAGGLMIMIFKPFKVGDYIRSQGHEGYVTEVNIVNTKIRKYDNTIVILANGTLFSGNLDNVTSNDYHRVEWKVDVAYGSDSAQVKKLLLEIMEAEPRILKPSPSVTVPAPSVNFNTFNDSSIEFVARGWVTNADYWQVLYDLNEVIYNILPQNGVQFPFPQMDVNLKKD